MAERISRMREALASFEAAVSKDREIWHSHERDGIVEQESFWVWYQEQETTRVYRRSWANVRSAVEATFMTTPAKEADDGAIMEALEAYAHVAESAFAVQTARDLYTPLRFQVYSGAHARIREGLLTDPDEAFVKSDVPWFLTDLRTHRAVSVG